MTITSTLTDPVVFDDKDAAILAERQQTLYDYDPTPRVGDWVDFHDGTVRRISHVWDVGGLADWSIQTSEPNGSFYLGAGYVSFSGSLYCGVKGSSLTDTNTWRRAPAWFFHHNWWRAHGAVSVVVEQRVWHCNQPAPTS